jgi:hypothetical protein
LSWQEAGLWFQPQGLLPDIYVHNTTIEDWEAMYAFLRDTYPVAYFYDSEPASLPASASDVFASRSVGRVSNPEDLRPGHPGQLPLLRDE